MNQQERNAKFRRENPDYQRDWAKQNREKTRSYYRKYAKASCEKIRARKNTPAAKVARAKYNREYYLANKIQSQAKHAVKKAIAAGILVRPSHCSKCPRKTDIEGHHDSYAEKDWLRVRWLCVSCHGVYHAERLEAETRGLTLQDARRGQQSILALIGDKDV